MWTAVIMLNVAVAICVYSQGQGAQDTVYIKLIHHFNNTVWKPALNVIVV